MKANLTSQTGSSFSPLEWLTPDSAAGPQDLVVPQIRFRRIQVRKSILDQYLRAAQRGEISFVKYFRLRMGIDQRRLGELAGMSQPAVAKAEKARQPLRMKGETLKRLAKALNVSADELLR